MVTVFSAIDCAQEGPTTEDLDGLRGRITASVTVRCKWENRLLLADDVLLNRRVYPLILTNFAPVAISCGITYGDSWFDAITDGQHRPPKTALVTINYGFNDTGTTSFDAVAESIEPLAEFRRLNHLPFRFGDQFGRPILPEESPGFLEIKLRLTRRVYRLNSMPAGVLSNIGKVNNAAYTSTIIGMTFAEETLLYDAPQPEITSSSTGEKGYNLTQNWVWTPYGWNKYYDPDTNTWDYYYHVNSPTPHKPYIPVDMSALF